MKTPLPTDAPTNLLSLLLILILAPFFGYAQVLDEERAKLNKPETEVPPEIFWHVKAYYPDLKLIDIKAIDKDNNRYDVKGIQQTDYDGVVSVKALVKGKRLPVKVVFQDGDLYYPVKAIAANGTLIDIKAITDDGQILDIKGVSRAGNMISLRAIDSDSKHYKIIAVSPDGKVNTVSGIKMMDTTIETIINGVSVFAHIKAMKHL